MGAGLQSQAAQEAVGRLAALPRVALLASLDHVDAAGLWSPAAAASFNWRLHDATTFQTQFGDLARAGIAAALAGGKCVPPLPPRAPCSRLHPAAHCVVPGASKTVTRP